MKFFNQLLTVAVFGFCSSVYAAHNSSREKKSYQTITSQQVPFRKLSEIETNQGYKLLSSIDHTLINSSLFKQPILITQETPYFAIISRGNDALITCQEPRDFLDKTPYTILTEFLEADADEESIGTNNHYDTSFILFSKENQKEFTKKWIDTLVNLSTTDAFPDVPPAYILVVQGSNSDCLALDSGILYRIITS